MAAWKAARIKIFRGLASLPRNGPHARQIGTMAATRESKPSSGDHDRHAAGRRGRTTGNNQVPGERPHGDVAGEQPGRRRSRPQSAMKASGRYSTPCCSSAAPPTSSAAAYETAAWWRHHRGRRLRVPPDELLAAASAMPAAPMRPASAMKTVIAMVSVPGCDELSSALITWTRCSGTFADSLNQTPPSGSCEASSRRKTRRRRCSPRR